MFHPRLTTATRLRTTQYPDRVKQVVPEISERTLPYMFRERPTDHIAVIADYWEEYPYTFHCPIAVCDVWHLLHVLLGESPGHHYRCLKNKYRSMSEIAAARDLMIQELEDYVLPESR